MKRDMSIFLQKHIKKILFIIATFIFILATIPIYRIMTLRKKITTLFNQPNTPTSQPKNLAQLHLFGLTQNTAYLPLSRIPLQLQGISFIAPGVKNNTAIIASSNMAAKIYHVGDTLPFNATIRNILPNQVNIFHNGQLERLILPTPTLKEHHHEP